MNQNLLTEILALYQKHGWQIRRLLLTPEARAELGPTALAETIVMVEAEIDAVWFSRGSQNQREAWELRLLAEQPFALFETFEADETEAEREERRQEMQATMRERISGP